MILDTNAVSALVEGNRDARRVVAEQLRLHMPVVVYGEFEYGLLGSSRGEKLRREFERLTDAIIPLPIEWSTGAAYAAIKHDLKRRGRPIPENDLWIAALAQQHDLPILSRDTHFDVVEGVTRVGW